MSRVYFHSADGEEAYLHGSERRYAGNFCSYILEHCLDVRGSWHQEEKAVWSQIVPAEGRYCLDRPESLSDWLAVSADYLLMGDKRVGVFSMGLQTMLDAGNDQMKLLARIHGQCEIHAWVEGPNRAWVANIIDRGLATSFYRKDMGWESVAGLLRRADDSPVVMSYSVCDGFPNRGLDADYANDTCDEYGERWYELPFETRWEHCIKTLRERDPLMEIKPDNWDNYYFRDGTNGFMYRKYMNTLKKKEEAQNEARRGCGTV
jgi:hypothetical protein